MSFAKNVTIKKKHKHTIHVLYNQLIFLLTKIFVFELRTFLQGKDRKKKNIL